MTAGGGEGGGGGGGPAAPAITEADFDDDSPPPPPPPPLPPPAQQLSTKLASEEVLRTCQEVLGHNDGKISTTLYTPNEDTKGFSLLPNVREAAMTSVKEETVLSPAELLPQTPVVFCSSKEEAFSPQMLEFCLQKPIVLIRNMSNVCGIDLSLYTTKSLAASHPSHPVEIRTQMEQSADENWDPTMSKQVWWCTSSRDHTTIAKYAEYQSESLADGFSMMKKGERSVNPVYDFSSNKVRRMIKFGTNCDLSDEKKWAQHQKELQKLPAWLRVVSAGNMLSHVGHQILGMNTVQLYMKVPCARTPGHQENNNFCAVNINVGPGDSEWFGVPNEYWYKLGKMCEKNSLNYLKSSWWPVLEELIEAGIPTYRFLQKPGDVVWVNAGCVHWVQATGWCNNIAWNVGPLSYRQYVLAMERYEWNKIQKYQSIVAMVFLSWNLARNIFFTDRRLHEAVRETLMQSLRISIQTLEFAKAKGVKIRFHGRKRHEPAHYCGWCDEEVFNVLFVKEKENRQHVVYCLSCALAREPHLRGFICLEEYHLEDLRATYDQFVFRGVEKEKMAVEESGYSQKVKRPRTAVAPTPPPPPPVRTIS